MAGAFKDFSERGCRCANCPSAGTTPSGSRLLRTRSARPRRPGGVLASFWGERTLALTFVGIVVGSVLSALPLVVQPIRNAFLAVGDHPLEMTGRVSPLYGFVAIIAPLARLELVKAAVLGFSHTIGTFGVVMMIGGNIPGRTKVLSAYVVDYVQEPRWHEEVWLPLVW